MAAPNGQMDPQIAALITAMATANEQSQRNHELALNQLMQNQNQFMERLGVTMAQRVGSAHDQETTRHVDPHGVGRPPSLTDKVARDPTGFRAWRIKFRNWIVASIPAAGPVMEHLEAQNQEEITDAGVAEKWKPATRS